MNTKNTYIVSIGQNDGTSRNIFITDDYVKAVARVEELRTPSMTLVDAKHYFDESCGATIVYQVAEPGDHHNYILIQKWVV